LEGPKTAYRDRWHTENGAAPLPAAVGNVGQHMPTTREPGEDPIEDENEEAA
jgi:hypothetical protein